MSKRQCRAPRRQMIKPQPTGSFNLLAGVAFLVCAFLGLSGPQVLAQTTTPATIATGKVPVTSFRLNNGMDVVVIEDHRVPVVTHMVWYRAGAADEDRGKSGIAHFLEHLLFKGTKTAPGGEFSKAVALNGGKENAFTTADTTAFYQRIARDRLEMVMAYEADRMVNLRLTEADIKTERDVVLEERASRTDNSPVAQLREQMNAALYLSHPYGDPIIGWEHEIKALNLADALEFYKRFYTPANAILVVAGDVTPNEVRTLAGRTYGKIARRAGATVARHRTPEPAPLAARRVILEDLRVGAPRWRRLYLTPSYSTAGDGEGPGLELLAQILGGGPGSRLYRSLVIEKKLAVDAGAYFQGGQRDYGEFGVYALPAPGVTVAEIESAVDAVIEKMRRGAVSRDELSAAKFHAVAQTVYARDSQYRLTRSFGTALVTGSSVAAVLAWPGKIEKTTVGQVRDAAKKYLDLKRSVTGILRHPAATKEPS
ncbi:MAG: M16 family metallopeptidase [Alphaproteobacteria bacterium]